MLKSQVVYWQYTFLLFLLQTQYSLIVLEGASHFVIYFY